MSSPSADLQTATEQALGQRKVRIEFLEETTERIDDFMSEGMGERPWEVFELTQSQDVRNWIEKPEDIDLILPMLEDLARLVADLPKPVRILDVGCYGGYVYDYLDRQVFASRDDFTYVGVDVQANAIAAAQALHADCENATFQTGDLYSLNETFEADAFDIALCYRVMIHIPHFEDCVRNLCHVAGTFVHTALWLSDTPRCRRCRETDQETGKAVIYYHRWVTPEQIAHAANAANATWDVQKKTDNPMEYAKVRFDCTKAG